MVVPRSPRPLASWLLSTSTRNVRATTRSRPWQQIQRRTYASEGHSSHKSSSDLPWAIGAIVVTVPSAIYLLQPVFNKKEHGHGHGHGGDEHGKHEGGEEHDGSSEKSHQSESEQKEADQTAETASSDGDSNKGGEDDGSAESDSSGPTRPDHSVEDAGQGTPDTSSDEDPKAGSYELDSGNNVEGVRFKGATSGGTRDGEQGDTRKHIPDAKGGAKHRIESHYGKELGSLKEEDPGDSDKPAGAKSTSSPGSISDKQRGLSNTQTKHSTDIDNDPGKSKKGEGYAETAKAQGAVDPQRPMAENRPGKENATGSQSDS